MLAPFDRGFNAAVLHIAGKLNPRGWAVSDDAPDTYEELALRTARDGRITVWSGGSARTIFGDPEVNYAFRAWHDWCHLNGQHDFSMGGEVLAALKQQEHLRALFGREKAKPWENLIAAEVIGQAQFFHRRGVFPADQRLFVRCWLAEHGLPFSHYPDE